MTFNINTLLPAVFLCHNSFCVMFFQYLKLCLIALFCGVLLEVLRSTRLLPKSLLYLKKVN